LLFTRNIRKKLFIDAKSQFQELMQEKIATTPIYKLIEESGPDHNKKFKIGVYIKNELVGIGDGSSKQEAEQHAAFNALKKNESSSNEV
jgi:ribonuclease-3